jgi:hypothetical protein
MGSADWVDFVCRLTTKHNAGYQIGDYADPSDLLEHLLSIVPYVEQMKVESQLSLCLQHSARPCKY